MWIPTTRVAGSGAFVFLGLCIVLVAGCARQRPVLYPNVHYKSVGQGWWGKISTGASTMPSAMEPVHSRCSVPPGRTAKGVAVGGVTGAAVGAVVGDVGTGAAAGVAGGAAAGLTRALFDSGKPDPVVRGFVEQCLKDLGYQITGWR